MNRAAARAYDDRVRARVLVLPLLAALALAASGCDEGGLLVVEGQPNAREAGGRPATEMVSAGNVAKNAKYKLVFTMGQPTPQGVGTGPNRRLNGGMPGAVSEP